MTTRELLEAAARAVGMRVLADGEKWPFENVGWFFSQVGGNPPALYNRADGACWSPLTDDGDALRLAVRLGLEIYHSIDDVRWAVFVGYPKGQRIVYATEEYGDDPNAAARRAITRAAAAIDEGRQTK